MTDTSRQNENAGAKAEKLPRTAKIVLWASGILLFLTRFAVYYFNSKYMPLHEGLFFTLVGALGDCAPFFFCLLAARLTRGKLWLSVPLALLAALYGVGALVLDIFNAASMYLAKVIFSYDLSLQIYGNTAPYLAEIIGVSSAVTVLAGLFVYAVIRLAHDGRRAATKCVSVLLLLSLAACGYYFITKDIVFFKGYGTREWVVRPAGVTVYDFGIDRRDWLCAQNGAAYGQGEDGLTLRTARQFINDPASRRTFNKIVIIAVESLDLAYLHGVNPDVPEVATREMDALAKDYLLHTDFFTAAQPTVRGLHALLSSRLDYDTDPSAATPSIFTAFAGAGYETWFVSAVSGNWGGGKNEIERRYSPQHTLFAEYLSGKYGDKIIKWGLDSKLLFAEAADILAAAGPEGKSLVFLSTIDTHPNYGFLPPEGDACFRNDEVAASPFLLALCHIDRAVGKFIRDLKQRGLFTPDTLVVLTADHSAIHGANYTKRSEYTPDRIPLVFITPDTRFFDSCTKGWASQIDLAPTLLDICGIMPPATFMGADMRRENAEAHSMPNHGMLWIRTPEGQKTIDLENDKDSPEARRFKLFYTKNANRQ